MLKNLPLRNHKVDEADTFHTCLFHYPLHNLCFCFDWVRTLVAMTTLFILLWLYLANSQVSVYRTIGPLVLHMSGVFRGSKLFSMMRNSQNFSSVVD